MIMPDEKPVEIKEEVVVNVPMSGAAMLQRLNDLKKEKELKQKSGDKK
jgi:hypothetical protein